MENHKNPTSPTTPQLCTAGCGYYGSEHFFGLCSKCYGAKNKSTPSSATPISQDSKQLTTTDQFTFDKHQQVDVPNLDDSSARRKHPRPSSSILFDNLDHANASTSSTPLVLTKPIIPTTTVGTSVETTTPAETAETAAAAKAVEATATSIPKLISTPSTADSSEANTPKNSDKPVQLNKGRCFKCRVKVPLAKQTINKCRCEYIFCDSHRFPDRHDCDVDYAKIGRELLAKNNPKLHERPKGGRSFKRIDSL